TPHDVYAGVVQTSRPLIGNSAVVHTLTFAWHKSVMLVEHVNAGAKSHASETKS
ncbi:hypothetical protein STEG23_038249, partial [Scotinomys teguina]